MINMEEVKAYNRELREQKEKASRLTAQIEMYNKELEIKCQELSKELGVNVTKENLEQIYNDYEQKLAQALVTGRAVLQKIYQDSALANTSGAAIQQNIQQQPFGVNAQNNTNQQQIQMQQPEMAQQVQPQTMQPGYFVNAAINNLI